MEATVEPKHENKKSRAKVSPSTAAAAMTAAGQILRRCLSDRIDHNPSYSLRAMAKSLGVSPGFLSQVINGRKRLSSERAIQFSQLMKLDSEQTNELLLAATVDGARAGSTARARLEEMADNRVKQSEFKSVEVEKFKVLSRWYHIAILDLIETEGFHATPTWIARRLKISPVQASDALERLQNLGLMIKAPTAAQGKRRWQKANSHLGFSAQNSNAAIREYHKQMIGKALENLSDATSGAFEKRSITGATIAIDPKRLPEAFDMIDRFRKKLEAYLSADPASEVYQINIQLFNLSHETKSQDRSRGEK